MRCSLAAVLVVIAAMAGSAAASTTPEQQLAARYAPIVALKHQAAACDTDGEPFQPVPADVVLGRPDVSLHDSSGKLVTTAPTAADLFAAASGDYLDLPGDPLHPGCSYEEWAKQISAGKPTTSYAHIVTEPGKPGKLALQYWFYYPFNDFNNKHESDWEMIQLMFDASTVADALKKDPATVGYSQHSGAERAAWGDSKLAKRGLHPIVYPGKGSHANYFSQTVWLGHGPEEGFGCDDTRGPSDLVQTDAVLLPATTPTSASSPFAWLAYRGQWGQKEKGPNNGPTGPNVKTQWTEPVTWSEDKWRSSSSAVPLQKSLGSNATAFFCSAVAAGSKVWLYYLRKPWVVIGALAGITLLGIWLTRRTQWRPALSEPLDRERTAGQIYRSGWRIYRRYWTLFLGLGLIFIPVSVIAIVVQQILFSFTGLGTLERAAASDRIVTGVIALALGQIETMVATVLVTAAVAAALDHIGEGGRPDAVLAYRRALPRSGSLALAWLWVIAVTLLLGLTVIGIPIAIVYLVRKSLVTQTCVVEHHDAADSLRRSSDLVRGHGPRVLAITALVNVTAYLAGPVLGIAVLFLTSSSLALIDLISSVVYVFVMPYVGLGDHAALLRPTAAGGCRGAGARGQRRSVALDRRLGAREAAREPREGERRTESDDRGRCCGRAEQQAGGEPEVDRLLPMDAEREQHRGGRTDVRDHAARGDRDERGGGGEAKDDESHAGREPRPESGEEQHAPGRAARPAAEQEEPGENRVTLGPPGWCATRSARRERRARLVTNGSFARCRPATRMPQAPIPKSTTRIIGSRKPEVVVAVAEIESGRNATASTSPSEMIERTIASSPSLTPGMRLSVPTLTT